MKLFKTSRTEVVELGTMPKIISLVVLASVMSQASAFHSAPPVCDPTLTSDTSIRDLGTRNGCLCAGDLGCSRTSVFVNGNEAIVNFLYVNCTMVARQNNIWVGTKPELFRYTQIYTHREPYYVTYYICNTEKKMTGVEFLTESPPPIKFLKELREKHRIFVTPEQLKDC